MKRFIFPAAALVLSACASLPYGHDEEMVACRAETFPVYFGRDVTSLNGPSGELLDIAAARIADCESGTLEIAGFTDAVGNAALNRQIANERAQAVLAALKARGVKANRIYVNPVGETGAINADGSKEPMRRRVEVNFVPS